jgi:Raf kinase inhibitor-like YbhB/YbcL family protein
LTKLEWLCANGGPRDRTATNATLAPPDQLAQLIGMLTRCYRKGHGRDAMLQYLPRALGRALRDRRSGLEKLAVNRPESDSASATIEVISTAFRDGDMIPVKCTADGEGCSPPLQWNGVPVGTTSIVVMIEDADSPTAKPLVHALVPTLPGGDGILSEGAMPSAANDGRISLMGRNSYFSKKYLPPDPPPAHGPHRYAFEVFALDAVPDFNGAPRRDDVLSAMRGHVLAKGCLVGMYERR